MENYNDQNKVDRVEIEFYTDPLCCWSWAFEPHWRRLRYEYQGKIVWRYRLGGLLPDWKSYNDPVNSVSRPIQMGPVWTHASRLSGMPIDSLLWFDNPPESSYPACIAVKCAQLQSPDAAEAFLRLTREAVMMERKNIAKEDVLLEIGRKTAEEFSSIFYFEQFSEDIKEKKGREQFKEDIQKARYHQISRFPTLTLRKPNEPGVMIVGYRPYDSLVTALEQVAPGIEKTQEMKTPEDYKNYWGESVSEGEINAAFAYEKSS